MSPPLALAHVQHEPPRAGGYPRRSPRRADLAGCTLVIAITAALCVPFIRSVFWLGDEGVLLAGAERLLKGQRLYRDFFEVLPPVGFVLTAAWLWLTDVSMLSARVLAILTVSGIAGLAWLACREICRDGWYPGILIIGWVVATQGYWTEVSHHWFTTLFAMASAWASIRAAVHRERAWRYLLIAGTMAGAAAMIVPPRGLLVLAAGAIAVSLSRFGVRRLVCYGSASLAVPLAILGYIAATGALEGAIYDLLSFPARQYTSLNAAPYGYFANLQNYPLLLVFPLAAVVAVGPLRARAGINDGAVAFLAAAAFSLAGFIGCFPRPDAAHLGFAAPLAFPLIAVSAKHMSSHWAPWHRGMAAFACIILCLPSVVAYLLIAQMSWATETRQTPRGTVTFLDSTKPAAALIGRIASTPPVEGFFFYPLMPLMPFLAGRQQISMFDVFTPGYTLPEQYREACIDAAAKATWLVIDRDWTDPDFLQKNFPRLENPKRDEARRFEMALAGGFRSVARYGQFELFRRNESFAAKDCDRIAGY